MSFKHVALIGLGLIASSISLALRRNKSELRITGFSKSSETRAKASKLKLCEVFDKVEEAVHGADLIILCVPVGAMASVVTAISNFVKPGAIITDVGSVKSEVINQLVTLIPSDAFFVPAHPLAGTEHSGPEAGFESLFDNRWCIITPTENSPRQVVDLVVSFWQSIGAEVEIMTPKHHDLVLAVTSHVPHLIAYTMVGVADDLANVTKSEVINYSAAGFRDFTRIAASDPIMWRDVFLSNKDASLEVLGLFAEELSNLQSAVERGDGTFLYDYFRRTRSIRRSIIDAGQDTGEPSFGRRLS
ncbi:MAG: prephenate/arogenate dehydrogenase family protein [Pseudomonadota bacterium]|nr:prephenate/arogenate dehydrogenase family protein [Pseudomonadota bacterium]